MTDPGWYKVICDVSGHPGHGEPMIACERKVRLLERGGGVGQWLLSVKAEHRDQRDRLRPVVSPMVVIFRG